MKILKLAAKFFVLGLIIIIGAIFLNLFAEFFNLSTWYDLFIKTDETLRNIGIIDIIFIFIIYLIFLGILASGFWELINKSKTPASK